MERLPGFRDFYPDPIPQQDLWSAEARAYIFSRWRQVARRYGFREYDGPPLEPLELFTVKSGEEIVGQLYNFSDKGGRPVALRPEMTPTLARMAAAHERQYKKPIKWFALPQLFRYERQQKGRLREHFQFNADILGEANPALDAELIALLIDLLRGFGLGPDDFVIRLSSRNVWHDFFRQRVPNASAAQAYAFFQIIDKLERETPENSAQKLAALMVSLDDVRQFIQHAQPSEELARILDNLEQRGLRAFVKVDFNVIRGLAYYTGVVFEAFDLQGEFRAIAGGGRYDNLVKLVSGGKIDLPAIGFGMGDVVLTHLLNARGLLRPPPAIPDAYCLIEPEAARPQSLRLIQQLRDRGWSVEYAFAALPPDKQFRRALELKARRVIQLGAGERAGSVQVKNLESRAEEWMTIDGLLSATQT